MSDAPLLILADGNNLAWAGYHALRRFREPVTPEEKVATALAGLTQAVLGLAARGGMPPTGTVSPAVAKRNVGRISAMFVAFDQGRPLLRRSIWPAYQTGRESDPQFSVNERFIVEAIRQFSELAKSLPITVAQGKNTEADDLIARAVLAHEGPARIASSDRDFLQLIDGRVSIYSPIKRVVVDLSNFDDQAAPKAANGEQVVFPRERYLDYRVASGDVSDDLPGLPGLGTLGAAKLLRMGPLDEYLEEPVLAARALGRQNARLSTAIRSGEAARIVARNRVLMDLRTAAARYDTLDGMTTTGTFDPATLRDFLQEHKVSGIDHEAAVIGMHGIAETSAR
jgi:DNA polymerase-1